MSVEQTASGVMASQELSSDFQELEGVDSRALSEGFIRSLANIAQSEHINSVDLQRFETALMELEENSIDIEKSSPLFVARLKKITQLLNDSNVPVQSKVDAVAQMTRCFVIKSNVLDADLLDYPLVILETDKSEDDRHERCEKTQELLLKAIDGVEVSQASPKRKLTTEEKKAIVDQLRQEYGIVLGARVSPKSSPKNVRNIKGIVAQVRQLVPVQSLVHLTKQSVPSDVVAMENMRFVTEANGVKTADGVRFYCADKQTGIPKLVTSADLTPSEFKELLNSEDGNALVIQIISSIDSLEEWDKFYHQKLSAKVVPPLSMIAEHAMLITLEKLVADGKIKLTEPYAWQWAIRKEPFAIVVADLTSSRVAAKYTAETAKMTYEGELSVIELGIAVEQALSVAKLSDEIVDFRRQQILEWCLARSGARKALEELPDSLYIKELENPLAKEQAELLFKGFPPLVERELKKAETVATVTDLYAKGHFPEDVNDPIWMQLTNLFDNLGNSKLPITDDDVSFWKEAIKEKIAKWHQLGKPELRPGIKNIKERVSSWAVRQAQEQEEKIKAAKEAEIREYQLQKEGKLNELKQETMLTSFLNKLTEFHQLYSAEFEMEVEELKGQAQRIDERDLRDEVKVKAAFTKFLKTCSIEELQVVSPLLITFEFRQLAITRADELGALDKYLDVVNGSRLLDWLPRSMLEKCSTSSRDTLLMRAISAGAKIEKYAAAADVNCRGAGGNTPLMTALSSGNKQAAMYLMSLVDIDLEVVNDNGQNLHHFVALHADSEIRDLWLSAKTLKADINGSDKKDVSPLMLAVERGDMDGVEAFIKAGASVDTTDEKDELIRRAIISDNPQILLYVASKFKCNLQAVDKGGNNYLHFAVRYSKDKCLEGLLQNGLSPFETNNEGKTPLEYAVDTNNIGCIRVFSLYMDLGGVVALSEQPILLYAVKKRKAFAAGELMSHVQFDETLVDEEGHNLAHIAAINGDAYTIGCLLKEGFDITTPVGYLLPANSAANNSKFYGLNYAQIAHKISKETKGGQEITKGFQVQC
ncbi:ankyrin repeat domain-containing protein [Parashewanella tropica]|uniref:ankyrin repeat domain-containing protein n=1 Tax=Parashewanella tropica TaxID=2547970 RepID=UPI0010595AE0|nr:ankyrin repeat domain-containing protein [Parashewanella tropica]